MSYLSVIQIKCKKDVEWMSLFIEIWARASTIPSFVLQKSKNTKLCEAAKCAFVICKNFAKSSKELFHIISYLTNLLETMAAMLDDITGKAHGNEVIQYGIALYTSKDLSTLPIRFIRAVSVTARRYCNNKRACLAWWLVR